MNGLSRFATAHISYLLLAKILHTAFFALWFARVAHSPAVQNNPVTKVVTLLGRQKVAQYKLNLLSVLQLVQTEPAGNSYTMRIYYYRGLAVNVANN